MHVTASAAPNICHELFLFQQDRLLTILLHAGMNCRAMLEMSGHMSRVPELECAARMEFIAWHAILLHQASIRILASCYMLY